MRRRLLIEESLAEVNGHLLFGPTKSHAARAVPLSVSFATAFESHLAACVGAEPDALVFTGPKGGPLRYRYVHGSIWRPTLKALGLPEVGLHALRHSAAARMNSAGASPKAVQSILGHESAAFTLTVYGHLFDTDLDDLAAKLDSPAASPRPEPIAGLEPESERAV
jgi:integrase